MTRSSAAADVRRTLEHQLRLDGSRPLVTFYDDATGERVELSVVTYANWVAKTAGLLDDELMVERGGTALVDLPLHWLGPVWLGALWSLGVAVTDDRSRAAEVDLVVCGPEHVAEHATSGVPVVALSLLPMAARFRSPLPSGVVDYGEVVWSQPDLFVPTDPPEPSDPAWFDATGSWSQQELLAEATGSGGVSGRILTEVSPTSRAGLRAFLGPLLSGDGTVWVRHGETAGPARLAERAASERAAPWPAPPGGPGQPPRS